MKKTFEVGTGSRTMTIEIDTAWRDIGHDLVAEGSQVPACLGYCADIKADLKQKHAIAVSEYSAWSAAKAQQILTDAPKLAEWKTKEKIRTDPTYVKQKQYIAQLATDLQWIEDFREDLQEKGQMIRSFLYSDRAIYKAGKSGYGTSDDNRGRIPQFKKENS